MRVLLSEFVDETMQEMEKRGFCEGEARHFVKMLADRIEENSKSLEYHKPFTVFKYPTDCNDQQSS